MRRPFRSRRLRAGFTLFEVLIALALSAMLLTAVLAALDLSIRMSVATPRSLQSAERAAMLLRAMAEDLRQVESPDAAVGLRAGLNGANRTIDERMWEGFAGGETWIAGRIGSASAATSGEPGGPLAAMPDSSDLWILYVGPESRRASFLTSDAPRCLARIARQGGAANGIMRHAAREDERSDPSPRADERPDDAGELLASDLRCRFRYFDGMEWQKEWNSRSRRSLPRAVEITLSPIDITSRDERGLAESGGDRHWKMVVSFADRMAPASSAAGEAGAGVEGRRP